MNKLWVYGDSFSMDMNLNHAPIIKEYVKFKNRFVKSYGHFISEILNLELVNNAIGGIDNFTIFESICKDIDNIKEDDLVIIGWSSQTRFRIVDESINSWVTVLNQCDEFKPYISNFSVKEILSNRLHKLYGDEIELWSKLIKRALKNNFIYFWSWYDIKFLNIYTTIAQETNGFVNDGHWSESGHKDFANYILVKLKEWKEKQLS